MNAVAAILRKTTVAIFVIFAMSGRVGAAGKPSTYTPEDLNSMKALAYVALAADNMRAIKTTIEFGWLYRNHLDNGVEEANYSVPIIHAGDVNITKVDPPFVYARATCDRDTQPRTYKFKMVKQNGRWAIEPAKFYDNAVWPWADSP